MKNLIIILSIALISIQSIAQYNPPKLNIPSSPAFSILNFEPTAVMRPAITKDLAADILNSFDKDGKLLMNLGLEFSPYWLKSNPTLDRKTYLEPNLWQSIQQSFSLSAATVKDSVSGRNKFGLGFRFRVTNGKPVNEFATKDNELREAEKSMSIMAIARSRTTTTVNSIQKAIDFIKAEMQTANLSSEIIQDFESYANSIKSNYTDAETKAFIESLISNKDESINDLTDKVIELSYKRKGLLLEFAGASGFKSDDDKNSLDRMGIWLNASHYVGENNMFTFSSRYMFQNDDSAMNNFDAGVSYLKQADQFNLSLEAMFRWYRAEVPDINQSGQPIVRLEKDFTYRLAFQASYLFSKDMSLNLNLGKDFDSPFLSANGFFSILGLNYTLFNRKKMELPPSE